MWGLIVCGVDVRVWIGCIMGCEVMIGAPASWRDTGKGICMMPWGMVTMGPAGFMTGIWVAVDAMCMSRLFCWWERRGGGEGEGGCVNRVLNSQHQLRPTPAGMPNISVGMHMCGFYAIAQSCTITQTTT